MTLTQRLVDIQAERTTAVLAVLGLVTVLLLPGLGLLEIRSSTEAILPQDDPVVERMDQLRADHAADVVYILVEGPTDRLQAPATMEEVERLQRRIERLPAVRSTTSPVDLLRQHHGGIPPSPATIRSTDLDPMMTDGRDGLVIMVRSDTQASPSETRRLRDDITALMGSSGLEYRITGYSIVDLQTFGYILGDFARITGVSFALVLTALFLVFRRLRPMLLAITPVMLALVWMLGIGGYLGVDLTIISMVSAAMIMGLGIDFGIHVVRGYERSEGGTGGVRSTMDEVGRGLLGGALTTGVGFLSLLAASLTGMHGLGIFLFTGILSAYIGAVVLVPALILLRK